MFNRDHRDGKARVCLGRRASAPQVIQILERRQVSHLPLHPKALRTTPACSSPQLRLTIWVVEWLRRIAPYVDRAESCHPLRLLLHTRKCCVAGSLRAGSGRTGEPWPLVQYIWQHRTDAIFMNYRRPLGYTTVSPLASGCELSPPRPFLDTC